MSLLQHTSIDVRFEQQVLNAQTYLLPFIEEVFPLKAGMKVMEIGCGEGGVLQPFAARGMQCLGVDLAATRIENGKILLSDEIAKAQVQLITQNVLDPAFVETYPNHFDLILLKDTIEHIPNQQSFITHLKQFLKPSAKIFFGFPPWFMPFGGHQQICSNKLLSRLPYYHILSAPIYKALLNLGKEPEDTVQELMEIKDTGITMHRFERIIKQSGLQIDKRKLFLINPIYQYKFGWKPKEQFKWLGRTPILKELLTTAAWYIVSKTS